LFSSELDAGPLAEGGRGLAQVDGHVEDAAAGDPHELALGLLDLVVQAAQHALAGAGVVVLHEVRREAGGVWKALALKLSMKKPRASPKTLGSRISRPGMAVWMTFIGTPLKTFSSRMRSRYWP
jgi:hypothetical protein